MIEPELNNQQFQELCRAVLKLKTEKESRNFLRDLCTLSELNALTERFQVAKRLNKKQSYREISKKIGASTTTVTRVAYWLHHGMGGYQHVLRKMNY